MLGKLTKYFSIVSNRLEEDPQKYFNKKIVYQNLDKKNQIDAYLPNINRAKSLLKLKVSLNLKKAIYKVIRDLNL